MSAGGKSWAIVDFGLSGHRALYLGVLRRALRTPRIVLITRHRRGRLTLIWAILKALAAIRRSGDHVHFADVDSLFAYLPLLSLFRARRSRWTGTIHHLPRGRTHRILLRQYAWMFSGVACHDEWIAHRLERYRFPCCNVVHYPFFERSAGKPPLDEALSIPDGAIVVSFMGEARDDKGLLLLGEALSILDGGYKESLLVNLCGTRNSEKEAEFRRVVLAAGFGTHQIRVESKAVSDSRWIQNIQASSVIVLPYSRRFTGASGPLIDAVWHGKPVVGPSHGTIGSQIAEHGLGIRFEAGDAWSLKRALESVLRWGGGWKPGAKAMAFRESLRQEEAVKAYRRFFEGATC